MGLNMVYRYRPMRMLPTMTTRLFIPRDSSVLGGLYGCRAGASTGNREEKVMLVAQFLTFYCVARIQPDIFDNTPVLGQGFTS